MKRLLFNTLLLAFCISMVAQSIDSIPPPPPLIPDYTKIAANMKNGKEWVEIQKYIDQDLPQSAIEVVDKIIKRAIASNDTQQLIKALICKNKFKTQIDSDESHELIAEIEKIAAASKNIPEKALLHSIAAELYINYLSAAGYEIHDRTALADVVPDDIKEWPVNVFISKIIEHLNLSKSNADVLKTHSTKEFEDIIIYGDDSPKFYPTLYDFVMERAISLSKDAIQNNYQDYIDISTTGLTIEQLSAPADEYAKHTIPQGQNHSNITLIYYQEYLKDLLTRNLTPTIILTEIAKNSYLANVSYQFDQSEKLETYNKLKEKYTNSEYCVEIIDKIAEIKSNNNDRYYYSYRDNASLNVSNEEIYNLCKEGIERYPDYYRIDLLKNRIKYLEETSISFDAVNLYYPQTPIKVNILYKNPQALGKTLPFKLYKKAKDEYVEVRDYPLHLQSTKTYMTDSDTINIGSLDVGSYRFAYLYSDEELKKTEQQYTYQADNAEDSIANVQYVKERIEQKKANARLDFNVSALSSFSRASGINEYEIFVVDRIAGNPMEGVNVKIRQDYYRRDKQEININTKLTIEKILKTDKLGLVAYKDEIDRTVYSVNNAQYQLILANDSVLPKSTLYENNYSFRDNSGSSRHLSSIINVFTDRSIYRPGQTVFYKAIILDENNKIIPSKSLRVELRNANNQVVEKKTLTTNEFGSISGEFILPKSGLTGTYSIWVNSSTTSFSVEEYKRPTFELTFEKVKGTYTFGQEVKLKGYAKNFSGISLQDATVKYTIRRDQFSFWRWNGRGGILFEEATVKTNADGLFEIVFTPKAGDSSGNYWGKHVYSFNINASITDLNGETQSADYSVNVGEISMAISLDIPSQFEKTDNSKISITAANLDREPIETSGTYTLSQLKEDDTILKEVTTGSFRTGEQGDLRSKLKTLPSGKYRLSVKAIDDKGNKVEEKRDFVLYSYDDKKPPIKTNNWLVVKNKYWDKNSAAEVIFGTSEKDTYILYQMFDNKTVFERRHIKLSDANQLLKIPYKEEYGNQVRMSFTIVKDGTFSNNETTLIEKKPEIVDKSIKTKLVVFRDKLRPSQSETWTISLSDAKGLPVSAETLASMYDLSLDKLSSYSPWRMSRQYKSGETTNGLNFRFAPYANDIQGSIDFGFNGYYYPSNYLSFDQINWYWHSVLNGGEGHIYFTPPVLSLDRDMEEGIVAMGYSESKIMLAEQVVMPVPMLTRLNSEINDLRTPKSKESDTGEAKENSTPEIRQNFNETAFFFPHLRTNEKGEVLISFTVPDSNTKWRFRTLSHDKDTNTGMLEQMVVTQKELMVTPNMPRFLRQGDRTSVSTKISNLSENSLAGKVSIEFFDPMTDKVIDLKVANQEQSFSVDKGASSSASWTFDVPTDIDMIGCRIVAQNDIFSDGEQHALVVLPNRMLVTESMTIDVNKAGTSHFLFDKLANNTSSSLSNYRLTLEYANNPAWYAVQALPTMSKPSYDNTTSWFASYYVNTLGSSIVKQYPRVSKMIEAWKRTGGDKQTLVSKLEKNEELKAVLLEETPWVMDAKDETEQMNRLALLFDLNNTKQLTDEATRKLIDLQTNEGGWSWYKGMYPSRSITQYVLYGYGELQHVGKIEYPEEVKRMQIRALNYIDGEIVKDFDLHRKNNKDWEKSGTTSTYQIEYLYVRSYYRDIPVSPETLAAERFYTQAASKNWKSLSMYERSILSIVLSRNGEKDLSQKLTKSITEHSKKDPKLGMYWPNNQNSVFLSMSAVTTHTFLMKALKENGANTADMDMMKQWLIKQKQTQVWETTHATIDAINILLSTGTDWFANDGKASIAVGNKTIDSGKSELGTGYIKQAWSNAEITKDMGNVTIARTDSQPAFGAVYWQYYEDVDKITANKNDLNVDKILLKEVVGKDGKSLVQITESSPLKIGDKVIVRLTVRINRDMEFVQIKDMRASCFEPLETLSGTKWQNNVLYYSSTKDASTNYSFDVLPKGTYVFEYPVMVNRTGEYSNGITNIQCLYAPEYTSHTAGIKVFVKE